METVFDYNITPEERDYIGCLEKEKELTFLDTDSANYDLASLFHLRGDKKKFKQYFDKLPIEMQNDLLRTIYHP